MWGIGCAVGKAEVRRGSKFFFSIRFFLFFFCFSIRVFFSIPPQYNLPLIFFLSLSFQNLKSIKAKAIQSQSQCQNRFQTQTQAPKPIPPLKNSHKMISISNHLPLQIPQLTPSKFLKDQVKISSSKSHPQIPYEMIQNQTLSLSFLGLVVWWFERKERKEERKKEMGR